MQGDSDEDNEQYEFTGKKVSRRDIQNVLHFAMSVQLMSDAASMQNMAHNEKAKIKQGNFTFLKKALQEKFPVHLLFNLSRDRTRRASRLIK